MFITPIPKPSAGGSGLTLNSTSIASLNTERVKHSLASMSTPPVGSEVDAGIAAFVGDLATNASGAADLTSLIALLNDTATYSGASYVASGDPSISIWLFPPQGSSDAALVIISTPNEPFTITGGTSTVTGTFSAAGLYVYKAPIADVNITVTLANGKASTVQY